MSGMQPRAHANISICGTADWSCIKYVDQEIQLKQNPHYKCDYCLNGCFSINYDPSFSTAKIFNKVPVLRKNGLDPTNAAILHVYYSRSTFRKRKTEPLYGFTEFLCNLFHFIHNVCIYRISFSIEFCLSCSIYGWTFIPIYGLQVFVFPIRKMLH